MTGIIFLVKIKFIATKFLSCSNDVINRWVYPMVPDMGICSLHQNYLVLRNNVYRNKGVKLGRFVFYFSKFNFVITKTILFISGVVLKEDVVIRQWSSVDDCTTVSKSVIGAACKIGKNCTLEHVYAQDNVTIADYCTLRHCVIGNGTVIQSGCTVGEGAVIGPNVVLEKGSNILMYSVQSAKPDYIDDVIVTKLGEHAYGILDKETGGTAADEHGPKDDSDDDDDIQLNDGVMRMSALEYNNESSVYSSSSDECISRDNSPILDDSNSKYMDVKFYCRRTY